ncbi:flagellin domain-containing protein [Dokdonella sp. MW10]|uniref:flagellin domain-containing protein n=1 Tax=Dokdonella sp. MW10 TaxID=2992926 RepID=UPI003F802F27
MALTINTNINSLNAQRNLNSSQSAMSTAMERLSSGLRINSAKDDAAGLAIANRFTTQVRGLNQAVRNANDGISLAQTTESALAEVTNNLQRIRELAVQSSNATNSDDDRIALNAEVIQRLAEIDRIATQTSFNGVNTLDGTAGTGGVLTFQVGANSGQTIDVDLGAGVETATLAIDAIDVLDFANSQAAIDAIDLALTTVSGVRSDLGAVQNRFESTIANLQTISQNLDASRSRIEDADFASETAKMTRAQILQQAGVSVLAQANSLPQTVLKLLG